MSRTVNNDDNSVDARKKKQILDRREVLDEWEIELYTSVGVGELSQEQANEMWGYIVRSYLKAVEPLLLRGDLERSEEVYIEQTFGNVWVPPPENIGGDGGFGKRNVSVEGDSPQPKGLQISGVKNVIENKKVTAEWEIQIRDPNSKNRRQTIHPTNTVALSYKVLENAVRVVDEWLQLNGIGIDTTDGIPSYGFEEVENDS